MSSIQRSTVLTLLGASLGIAVALSTIKESPEALGLSLVLVPVITIVVLVAVSALLARRWSGQPPKIWGTADEIWQGVLEDRELLPTDPSRRRRLTSGEQS